MSYYNNIANDPDSKRTQIIKVSPRAGDKKSLRILWALSKYISANYVILQSGNEEKTDATGASVLKKNLAWSLFCIFA